MKKTKHFSCITSNFKGLLRRFYGRKLENILYANILGQAVSVLSKKHSYKGGHKKGLNATPPFNYLGQSGQGNSEKLKEKNIWQIVGEDSGILVTDNNWDTSVITFNGLIMDGRLKFSLVSKLDVETTNMFTRVFKEHISDLISHCINNQTIEYTISDFNDFEPYVLLNHGIRDRHNLFMFPPGFGGAESYFMNIAPRLRNKRLTLFNNFYMHIEKKLGRIYTKNLTYEKLAEDFITYIKLIQPKGPYNLFGWSFGGILAFEISKKLMSGSDSVANLILLDAHFNCKNINLKIDSKSSLLEDINFKYTVCPNTKISNTNIMLFKVTKVEEINFYIKYCNNFGYTLSREEIIEIRKIDKFYAKKN